MGSSNDHQGSHTRIRHWPGLGLTVGGYALAFGTLLFIARNAAGAAFHIDVQGLVACAAALGLMGCSLWVIGLASGLKPLMTIVHCVGMGFLADLLMSRGFERLYGLPSSGLGNELVFLLLVALSLILLATRSNADNLSRQQQEQQTLETDVLTGLLNRRGIVRRYAEWPDDAPLTVIMLDLNDLKSINDVGGHSLGDRYLQSAAQALRRRLPEDAILGRWGGDEFVAVVPGTIDMTPIQQAIQTDVPHPETKITTFASGTIYEAVKPPLERILAQADELMYADKAQAYQQVAAQEQREQITMSDFPHYLLGLNSQSEILHQGLDRAARLAGFERWFYVTKFPTPDMVCEGQTAEYAALKPMMAQTLSSSSTLISDVLTQQRTIWAADYEKSPYAQQEWVDTEIKSLVVAPVFENGEVRSAVAFFSQSTWRSATPQAQQLLETVATRLGHQLERDTVVYTLNASLEASIRSMGVVLETRDIETAGHTERVVNLARQLARALGLDYEQIHQLQIGAYLHDIGKLSIPDRVLLKPGPLDAEEWALMTTHSEVGAAMAEQIPSLPQGAASVIRHHHERWDGAGYPQGLQGEAIPFLARIFALCDVYDALTHVRPYKKAWTSEQACAEIAAQAGRQFDPELTAIFLEHVVPHASAHWTEHWHERVWQTPPA